MAEAELTTLARPYARAAFSHALEHGKGLADWSSMLGLLSAALTETAVQEKLHNPLLTRDDETSLLFQLTGDDLNQGGRNFVSVLAENGRLALLPTIAEIFEQLRARHEKTLDVQVSSAFKVSAAESTALETALQQMLQRDVALETKVDESLLGGVVIKAEDMVIDDSVKGKLEKLSQELSR